MITCTKLYVLVVTLPLNDNIKFLQNINKVFKTTISWNKYRSEITTQTQNNNLYYIIDPTFRNINGLLALSFTNGNDDPMRDSFDKCYMPLAEIKYFNALIENKPFFDQSVKSKQEAYEKLIEMSKNDDYATGNLSNFYQILDYNSLVQIYQDKKNASILQQINFVGKLEEDDSATMFFITEKQQKAILNFSLDSLIITE